MKIVLFPKGVKYLQYSLLVLLVGCFFVLLSLYAYRTFIVNKTIKEFCGKYHVSFRLAHDIALAESSLNPNAKGSDGGLGLYQFMPKTWAWATKKLYGKELGFQSARTLKINAEVGVWFISWLEKTLKKENSYSEAAVVYCFNAGIGKFRDKGYAIPNDHKNKVYDKYFKRYYRKQAEKAK